MMTPASPLISRAAFVAALVLAQLGDAPRADACSSEPIPGLGDVGVLPATGTTAPRNTRIWIPQDTSYNSPDIMLDSVVVKSGDVVIPTDISTIVVEGELKRTVSVFAPTALLPAGSTIVVTVAGVVATQFTVAADEDTTAPQRPVITSVDVEGGYFGGFSCPYSAMVTVTVDDGEPLLLLTERRTTTVPTAALAMDAGTRVAAVELPDGEQTLHLLAVDLSGNVTPVQVPTFTVPTEQSGCGVTPHSISWPVALAAVLVWRRRRRRA